MKVALFVGGFPVPSETFVLRQATGLLRQGVDLTILVTDAVGDWSRLDPEQAAALAPRVRRIGAAPISRPRGYARLAALLARAPFRSGARRRLRAALAARREGQRHVARTIVLTASSPPLGRFDAILAHFGPLGVQAMHLRAAGLIDGPIATVFHGYDMSRHDTLARHMAGYRGLFRRTELMLPISALWRERLIAWGAPAERVHVHRMGVDPPAAPTPRPRDAGTPLRVLTVGRFTEKKGLGYAIAGVRRCAAPAELSLIGYGELEGELRRTAALPGSNPVHFLGALPHADVLAAMARADVFLLPSVTAADGDMEGIPVSLMEAMVRGCIVIATTHSGIPELVATGRSGLLVAERSADEIARALERVAAGTLDLAAMREAARARVHAAFDNDELERELVGLLAGPAMRDRQQRL